MPRDGGFALVLIGDQRANARNPDDAAEPGFISVSNTTFAAKAPFAVARKDVRLGSTRKLVLTDEKNAFAEGTAFFDGSQLPSVWTLKGRAKKK